MANQMHEPEDGVASGLVVRNTGAAQQVADRLPDGWRDWLQWNEACDQDSGTPGREALMLHADAGRALGFTRVVARRNA